VNGTNNAQWKMCRVVTGWYSGCDNFRLENEASYLDASFIECSEGHAMKSMPASRCKTISLKNSSTKICTQSG